jgi:DNA-binding MarR family transcriptional regulator
VLAGISRHGEEGITQTELARVLDLGKVALGGLIDRLEDRGFVERKADASDRRINRVLLTRKGNQVLDRMQKIGMDMNAKVMKGISLERQHMLSETLHEMKENLIALDTVPGSKAKNRAED